MKCIQQIDDVKEMFIYNNQFIYVGNNTLYISDQTFELDEKEIIHITNEKLFKINYYKQTLHVLENNKFVFINTDLRDGLDLLKSKDFVLSSTDTDTRIKTENSEFGIKGIHNILFSSGNLLVLISYHHDKINNTIQAFNKHGQLLWSYISPEDFYEYEHLPIVVENILIFTTYDEHRYNELITGIEIETGKIVWQNKNEITQKNRSLVSYIVNDNLLYMFGYAYLVFNPKSGKVIHEKHFEDAIKYNLTPHTNSIYDNKLWFVSSNYDRNSQKSVKFGYVNLNNHELELIQNFDEQGGELTFAPPIYHQGKLYLLGKSYRTLYVFE